MKKQIDLNKITNLKNINFFSPDYHHKYKLFKGVTGAVTYMVYSRILWRSGNGVCFESQSNMAEGLEIRRETVNRHLNSLLKNGLIYKISSKGNPNKYQPLSPEFWNPEHWCDPGDISINTGVTLGSQGVCSQDHRGCDPGVTQSCSPSFYSHELSPIHIPAREEKREGEEMRERERTLCEEEVESDRLEETSLVVSESSQAQISESDSRQFPKTVDKIEQPTENKESEAQIKTEEGMLVAKTLNEQAKLIKSASLTEKPVLKGTDQKVITSSGDKLLRGGGENFTQEEWEAYAIQALQEVGLNYEEFIQYQRNVNLRDFKAFTVDCFHTGKNAFYIKFCVEKGKSYPTNFLKAYIGRKTANQRTSGSSDQVLTEEQKAEIMEMREKYLAEKKAEAAKN